MQFAAYLPGNGDGNGVSYYIPDSVYDINGIGGDGREPGEPEESYAPTQDADYVDPVTAENLTQFASALYRIHCCGTSAQLDINDSNLYSFSRAYMLNWYQSHYTDDPYVYYSRLPEIYPDLNIDFNHTPKTILEPKIEQSFAVFISARFLDNDGNPLKDTEVILLVDYEEYRTRTDEDGVAVWDLMLSGDYFFAIINPVTGECYIFPELMHVSFYSNATVGFRRDGNTHMFTVNSNGLKSTIKNDKGIVSKAITFSKDKVIISTKTNDSIDQMVIDRFTRYSIYLIAILCILVPIGILRYRKK